MTYLTDMNMKSVALRIREQRLSQALTQADLARLAGVSTRSITRIEAGNSCDLATFMRILEPLGFLDRFMELFAPQLDPFMAAEREKRGAVRQRVRRPSRVAEQKDHFQWGEDQ